LSCADELYITFLYTESHHWMCKSKFSSLYFVGRHTVKYPGILSGVSR